MRVALAVPCFVDQLRPQAARAALVLLERLGCEVSLAFEAPCCGQPMHTAGARDASVAAARAWSACAGRFDHVVMPSGSCVHHVRHHLPGLDTGDPGRHAARVTHELCEFIAGPLGRPRLAGRFPHRVALHLGCHAQRGLRLGGSSERGEPPGGPVHGLVASFRGIEVVVPTRPDECCGFGGVFAVDEPEVSVAMGRDRLAGFLAEDAEVLVSSDPSCLLHLEAIARHAGMALRCITVAELLEEATR